MAKLVRCKTCGAEIAKTARFCPNCGAQQHVGALSACAVIIVITLCAIIAILAKSCSGGYAPQGTNNSTGGESPTVEELTITTSSFTAKVEKCFAPDFINGAFYIKMSIENTSDTECIYMLDDVYVDDSHCYCATGMPITTMAGKKVTGSFIISCETPLSDVGKIDFSLVAYENNSVSTVEKSESVTIYPNK